MHIGIFVLPRGTSIPLHDHPDMTVLSKVLFGEVEVTSFDRRRVDVPARGGLPWGARGRRRMVCSAPTESVVREGAQPVVSEPLRGNLHAFAALRDTAIFDVLLPPYDDFGGRSCHYYEVNDDDSSASAAAGTDGVILTEMSFPKDLRIVAMPYDGPGCIGRSDSTSQQ